MKIRRFPALIATLFLAFAGATMAAPDRASCQGGPCAEAGCTCKSIGNWTCAGDCSSGWCDRTWLASFRSQ